MKKLLILLAFAFLFLSLTSASSFDERKKYLLDYYSKARPNDQYWGDNDIKTALHCGIRRNRVRSVPSAHMHPPDTLASYQISWYARS